MSTPSAGNRRPNFLVFVADQMQSFALGCNGNRAVRTPNLDRLAAAGVSFRRAYCNNSVCTPSRAGMITGLTPRQHGCVTNGNCLPERVPTITGALAAAGYRTHAVGKLHLQPFGGGAGSWEDRRRWNSGEITALPPNYYGFQTTDFVGGHVSYCFGDYARDIERRHPGTLARYQRENSPYVLGGSSQCWRLDLDPELHYNHWIADRSIGFLEREGGAAPFFLWCSFPDPHFPFAACGPYATMTDPAAVTLSPTWRRTDDPCAFLAGRRETLGHRWEGTVDEPMLREMTAQTYGMIAHVDDNIGRVLRRLEETGLAENTVVVFMADHGEYLGAHNLLYKGPWPYEELLRVPFLWRAPGGPAVGGADAPASLLDFAPTILDFAGIAPSVLDMRRCGQSDRPVLPGRSLRPLIAGGAEPAPRSVIVEYDEDWFPGPLCRERALVTERYKLAVFAHSDGGVLFDLERDPHETHNFWRERDYAGVRAHLAAELLDELTWTDRFDTERLCGA